MTVGDDVTLNAKVIFVTASGNPIVALNSGHKILVRPSDINTERPRIEIPEKETPLFREKDFKNE